MHFPETPNIAVASAVLDSPRPPLLVQKCEPPCPSIKEDVARHSYFGAVIKNSVVLAMLEGVRHQVPKPFASGTVGLAGWYFDDDVVILRTPDRLVGDLGVDDVP